MSKATHLALRSFPSSTSLSFSCLIPKGKLNQKLAAAAAPPGSVSPNLTCTVDVLIFGPSNLGDVLARHLCRCRLFLQHPHSVPTSVKYENPQYLEVAGNSFHNDAVLPLIPDDPLNNSDDDEAVDLPTVIDNLPRHDYLQEVNIDEGILTTLLR